MNLKAQSAFMRGFWGSVLFSILLLAGCAQKAENEASTPPASTSVPATNKVADIKALKNQDMLHELLGAFMSSGNILLLHGKDFDLAPLGLKWADPSAEIVPSVWFRQDFSIGQEAFHVAFIQLQEMDNSTGEFVSGHSTGAAITALTYKKTEQGWQVVERQKTPFSYLGAWGNAPQLEAEKPQAMALSPDKFALLVPDSFSSQGYTSGGVSLFIFDGTLWRDLGFIQVKEDNSGACSDDKKEQIEGNLGPCWKYQGQVSVMAHEGSGYPDLLVKYQGMHESKNGLSPVPDATYTFKNGKYTLQERPGKHG